MGVVTFFRVGGGGRDHNSNYFTNYIMQHLHLIFVFLFCFNHCPLILSKDGHVTLDLQHGQQSLSQSSAVHMTAKQALSRLISTNSEHTHTHIYIYMYKYTHY